MWPLAFAVLLELDAGLTTAAQGSPRPRECRGAASGEGGVWLRLRDADAQRYCDLLGRAYARLGQSPQDALSAAQAAEALAGAVPAVRVLSGRARLRLAQSAIAYELFAQAELADAQSFADPKALHDYARSASLTGNAAVAVRLYRLLMSRAALLDDPRERLFCQIEAAAHVLAQTPSGADEALGYLAQARQQPLGLSAWIDGLRLLALKRGVPPAPSAAKGAPPSGDGALGAPPQLGFDPELPLLAQGQFEAMRSALRQRAGARSVAPEMVKAPR